MFNKKLLILVGTIILVVIGFFAGMFYETIHENYYGIGSSNYLQVDDMLIHLKQRDMGTASACAMKYFPQPGNIMATTTLEFTNTSNAAVNFAPKSDVGLVDINNKIYKPIELNIDSTENLCRELGDTNLNQVTVPPGQKITWSAFFELPSKGNRLFLIGRLGPQGKTYWFYLGNWCLGICVEQVETLKWLYLELIKHPPLPDGKQLFPS